MKQLNKLYIQANKIFRGNTEQLYIAFLEYDTVKNKYIVTCQLMLKGSHSREDITEHYSEEEALQYIFELSKKYPCGFDFPIIHIGKGLLD